MRAGLDPFSFLVISIAGWMNQRQQQVIEYLVEEFVSVDADVWMGIRIYAANGVWYKPLQCFCQR